LASEEQISKFPLLFRIMRGSFAAIAICAAIALAGCGGDDSSATGSSGTLPTASPAEAAERSAPRIRVPNVPAPGDLVRRDLIEGTGPAAQKEKKIVIRYFSVDYATGKGIGAPWSSSPSDFELGEGSVIRGVEKGVEGMKAGGRRELIIPPDLAWGEDGAPPKVGPDATVVFVIDVLAVE
jgi:peptidylprolyl isomerase